MDFWAKEIFAYRKKRGRIVRERIEPEQKESLRLELEHFLYCVRRGKIPLVSGEDAKRSLEVALKINRIMKRSI